jgi:hypothetical protein
MGAVTRQRSSVRVGAMLLKRVIDLKRCVHAFDKGDAEASAHTNHK